MNTKIIVSSVVIVSSGVLKAIEQHKAISPVVEAGYIFMLLLSLLDVFGGKVAQLASALALLAMVSVLINQFPLQLLTQFLQNTQKKG